jgi:hypothetical protein
MTASIHDPDPRGTISLSPDEPVVAGSEGMWSFVYTAGSDGIAVGGGIRIRTPQHHSYLLRYFVWELGQIECWSDSQAVVTASLYNSGLMRYPAICVHVAGAPLQPGETVSILVGDTLAGGAKARAQKLAWKDRVFRTEVDIDGSGQYKELERSPHIDVLPDEPACMVAVAPSMSEVGKPFDLIVRVEDQYTNICTGYQGTIRLTCTDLEAELPSGGQANEYTFAQNDQGIARIAGCQLRSEGTHHIFALEAGGGLEARSNPIQVVRQPPYHLYAGDLHAQSGYHIRDLEFGTNTDVHNYARYVQGLNFCACTDVVSRFRESEERQAWWAQKLAETEAVNCPGEFVAIQAYEWNSRDAGHRNVFFPGSQVPMYEYRHGPDKPQDGMWGMPDPSLNTPDDLHSFLQSSGAITIPHHPNSDNDYSAEDLPRERRKHNWHPHDWSYGPYDNEPLIEIYQGRGSFETDYLSEWVVMGGFGSSVQDGLALGRRLGFVGGSDSHIGRTSPAIVFPDTIGKRGGLTYVYAEALTRESIFAALRQRRTYATNGRRMILWFEVNGTPLGSEIDLDDPMMPRQIHCQATGTDQIDRIEIIRDNALAYTHYGHLEQESFTWTDSVPCRDGTFYYVRVIQRDNGIGWASPVWVNL